MGMYGQTPAHMYAQPGQWQQNGVNGSNGMPGNIQGATPNQGLMYYNSTPQVQVKNGDSSRQLQEVSTAMFMTEMHNSPMAMPKSQPATPGASNSSLATMAQPPAFPQVNLAIPVQSNGALNGQVSVPPLQPFNRVVSSDIGQSYSNGDSAMAAMRQEQLPPLTSKEIQAISQVFTEGFKMSSLEEGTAFPYDTTINPLTGATVDANNSIRNADGFATLEEIDNITIPQLEAEMDISHLTGGLRQHPSAFGGISMIPSRGQLDRYLSVYFNFVHPLLPLLHPQSFRCMQAPPALIYAICALGATTCHEKSMSQLLSYNCRLLVTITPQKEENDRTTTAPLGITQAMCLLLLIATFSGDRGALDLASNLSVNLIQNCLAMVQDVSVLRPTGNETSRSTWVQREEIIRAFWMAFVTIGLLHAHCGLPVSMPLSQIPVDMPLPGSEVLWNATFTRDEDWQYYNERYQAEQPPITFGELMGHIESGKTSEFPSSLSPFALRILAVTISLESSKDLVHNGILLWAHTTKDIAPGSGQAGLSTRAGRPYTRMVTAMGLRNLAMSGGSRLINAIEASLHPLILTTYAIIDSSFISTVIDMSLWRNNLGHLDAQAIAQAAYDLATRPMDTDQLTQLLPMAVRTVDLITSMIALGPHLLAVVMAAPMSLYISHLFILTIEEVIVTVVWFHRISRLPRSSLTPDQLRVLAWTEMASQKVGIHPIENSMGIGIADAAARCYEAVKPWVTCEVMAVSIRILISHLTA